jgi:NAD(P)-dependent dehydrogenase (short-subunit alcohol dehydrogenase family)
MIDLSGRNYLVIGGSGFLGRAIALAIGHAGGRVAITFDQNLDGGKATVRMLGGKALPGPYRLDVVDQDSLEAFIDDLKRDGVRFDGLVYGAGVNSPGSLEQVKPEVARWVIKTNTLGAWNVAQQITPFVDPEGSIVFIGSSCAYTGGRKSVHYAASKSFLSGLVTGLAWQLGDSHKFDGWSIRVNVIHPGYVESPMADKAGSTTNEAVERSVLKRLARAEEIAGPVLWLLSDLSSYVTGQEIRVDGGLLP